MSVLFEEIEHIPINGLTLEGMLAIPPGAKGVVLFAHGSGSSRHSPRNNFVARVLCDHGVGTLLMDLLSPEEDQEPTTRFDIALLTERLVAATHWLHHQRLTRHLPVGYFGATHLFEEPDALETVARHAAQWFGEHVHVKH